MSDCCDSYKDKNFCADCGKRLNFTSPSNEATYFDILPKDIIGELVKKCDDVDYKRDISYIIKCLLQMIKDNYYCTYCKNYFEYKKGITLVYHDTYVELCHNSNECLEDILNRCNVVKKVFIIPNIEKTTIWGHLYPKNGILDKDYVRSKFSEYI